MKMFKRIILTILVLSSFGLAEDKKAECNNHIEDAYKFISVDTKESLPQEDRYMILMGAFESLHEASTVCAEKKLEFVLDTATSIDQELTKIEATEREEGDCKSLIMDGLNVTGILDVRLPIEVQSMMLMSALNYFEQATKVCPIPSDDFFSAYKYAYNTSESLEDLETIHIETLNLAYLRK